MRRRIGTAVLAVCALVLAGCAAAPAGPVLLPGATQEARPAWTVRVALIGEPVVHDGVVASYVRGGPTGLQVRAWSLLDGRELWTSAALVGRAPQGVEVTLAEVRFDDAEYVTFLAPAADRHPSELVVAQLATGTRREVHAPAVDATVRPSSCSADVCFTGWSLDTRHLQEGARQLRLDLRTGRIRFDADRSAEAGSLELGDGLFAEQGADDAQELVRIVDGRVRWRQPYPSVFGSGATTAGGWDWRQVGALLIGVGGRPGVVHDGEYRSDLAASDVVALDPATGRVRWRIRGAAACRDGDLGTSIRAGVLELCRYRGRAAAPVKAHVTQADVVYTDAQATRVGVAVRTGRVRWSLPLDPEAALGEGPFPVPFGRWRPTLTAHGVRLLDRGSGRLAEAAPGTIVACSAERPALRMGQPNRGDYAAGASAGPCTGAVMSRSAVTTSGTAGGDGWWVVPGSTTLSAYALR